MGKEMYFYEYGYRDPSLTILCHVIYERLGLFVGFYHRAPLVGTTTRACMVRHNSLSALRTGCGVGNRDLLVGTPHIPF